MRPLGDNEFWNRVSTDGECWEWLGAVMKNGYGTFRGGKRKTLAHRFSYELSNGPAGDLFVLHRCDNRRCVRPDHLFLGTAKDNTADMIAKGRDRAMVAPCSYRGMKHSTRGTIVHTAKLNDDAVRDIRIRHSSGASTMAELATEYKVSHPTVASIVHGRSWRHVS